MAHNAMGRLLCRQTTSIQQSINFIQRRNWSARTVPSLAPTGSPELDETLLRFRDELFIPHSLHVNQRNLIYSSRHSNKLLSGHPIIVPIGKNEEPYRLRPISFTSLPSRKQALRALALMHETGNWSNLVLFLTGIHNSGRSLRNQDWEWLVRKVGGSDGFGALLTAAQQAESTHLFLKNISLVERLFFELHLAGQRADFQGPGVGKAHGFAKSFSLLLESPEHAVHDLEADSRRSTLVIATLLELSAARGLSQEGYNNIAEVESYARRLIASLKTQNYSIQDKDWVARDQLLQTLVPAHNSIKLAIQLEDIASQQLGTQLKARMNELGTVIVNIKNSAPQGVQEKPSVGLGQAQLLHQSFA
ncbi:hypothetical protein BDV19DRAFT_373144 [Aspergillus venezuelensis]